ncbi:MAG: hypothetical protein LBE78_01930 [Burkholderiaceae bacterium]|nr:hypothetical protein [Burkholderiaceae bacterium]
METVIVDAETGAPVDGAGVYAVGYSSDQVRLLTTSDQNGAVLVAPSRKFSIQPLPPKESADLQLWACKDGFEPRQIAARSGWKVYFDAETHKLAQVRLKRDGGDTSASCPSRIPR